MSYTQPFYPQLCVDNYDIAYDLGVHQLVLSFTCFKSNLIIPLALVIPAAYHSTQQHLGGGTDGCY